jgi:hypothetical protein
VIEAGDQRCDPHARKPSDERHKKLKEAEMERNAKSRPCREFWRRPPQARPQRRH